MKKILLCVMDGVGYSNIEKGNAVKNANTPNLDKLESMYPHSHIEASGIYVGLPKGQMGNSEVGHLNIGAGRIVYQLSQKISNEIKNKEFFKNIEHFLNSFKFDVEKRKNIHFEFKDL